MDFGIWRQWLLTQLFAVPLLWKEHHIIRFSWKHHNQNMRSTDFVLKVCFQTLTKRLLSVLLYVQNLPVTIRAIKYLGQHLARTGTGWRGWIIQWKSEIGFIRKTGGVFSLMLKGEEMAERESVMKWAGAGCSAAEHQEWIASPISCFFPTL